MTTSKRRTWMRMNSRQLGKKYPGSVLGVIKRAITRRTLGCYRRWEYLLPRFRLFLSAQTRGNELAGRNLQLVVYATSCQ